MPVDTPKTPTLVTLGMFIIDEFEYLTEAGEPTGKASVSQASFVLVSI